MVTSGGTSGSDGATTLWFVVPTAPGGPQTVTVSDGIHSASSGVPWTLRAGLAVSPSHGTSGTLSGTGFDAAEPVSATLAGGSLTLDPTNPTVQADGSWTATFTTTAPDGPAVIEATDGGGAGASTTFTVGATLSFATDQSITKLPATIVGGSAAGFGDAEQLAFHLDSAGGPLLASSPPTVTTDAAGSASDFSVTVPADTADGPHTVVAVGASSGVTATSETVSVEAASTFTIAANQQVSTSALPAQVTGGSVADFGSTEGLTIHLDTATGPLLGTTPSTLTTAGDGQAGGIDATIPSGTAAGSHVLVAVGGTSGQVATSNTFVVQPAITHVQDAAAGGTNVATVSPTLSSPPTSGDTLVLVVADDGVDGARVVSVSGGGVAAWTDVTSVIGSAAADPGAAEIWYGPVTCGPCGAGDRTVSVTMSQPTGIQLANVSEWAGISAANPVDATTGGSGSGSAFAAGPTPVGGSLLEPGELVVSAAWVQPGDALTASQDAATGFTLLDQAAGDQTAVRGAGAYLIDPSSAPVRPTGKVRSSATTPPPSHRSCPDVRPVLSRRGDSL